MTVPFDVAVLGGTFRVVRLETAPGQDPATLAKSIRTMPEERWFVMSGEEGSDNGDAPDTLALIDDDFKFRTFAYGRLETP